MGYFLGMELTDGNHQIVQCGDCPGKILTALSVCLMSYISVSFFEDDKKNVLEHSCLSGLKLAII